MKISQEKTSFTPITLTIESLSELEWLAAIADTAVNKARRSAEGQGFILSEEAEQFQMTFYNAITAKREENS